ncbi:MAG: hypothetical protein PVJ64_00465 [Gemmatimonadales bacterium]|jgi:hypothetical protein
MDIEELIARFGPATVSRVVGVSQALLSLISRGERRVTPRLIARFELAYGPAYCAERDMRRAVDEARAEVE